MDSNTQRCPLCAEDMPRTATVCPYCGAKFSVSSSGYCITCHAVREADSTGLCNTCNNPVADWQVESQLIEEPAPRIILPAKGAAVGASGADTKPAVVIAPSRAWMYAGIGGILLLAVIMAFAWYGRSRSLAIASLVASPTQSAKLTSPLTITPSPLPTYTPSPHTPSLAPTRKPTATIQAWISDFAEPLLAEIANHAPDVDEDFPGKWSQYLWTKSPSVSFSDGALHMIATDGGASAVTGKMADGQDFILQYDLTLSSIDTSGGAHVLFRSTRQGNKDSYCHLGFTQESSWDISCFGVSGDHLVASGKTPQRLTDRTTQVTLIVIGADMALYLNGQPVGHGQDEDHLTGGGPNFNVNAPQGTTTADIDNVKFWDLNNLKPKE